MEEKESEAALRCEEAESRDGALGPRGKRSIRDRVRGGEGRRCREQGSGNIAQRFL